MAVISWLLFGVYQIGYTIEDPFQGSLRLSILCDAVYRDVMYDADMKNKRDSAYELEDELIEWDRLGPVDNSKLLLSSSSPSISQMDDQTTNTDISFSNSYGDSSETNDDPLQPRP